MFAAYRCLWCGIEPERCAELRREGRVCCPDCDHRPDAPEPTTAPPAPPHEGNT